jgi:hypothetical protein
MRQINAASGSSGGGGGGSTIDRELVVTTYSVKTAFSGASVGDTITQTQIIDVTSSPYSVLTLWRNQTTNTDLVSAPSAANLTLVGSGSLSDAQLRASPVPIAVTDGLGNPITSTGGALDVNIKTPTSISQSLTNLDVDLGNVADPVATSDTGSFSLISLVKRQLQKIPSAISSIASFDQAGQPVRLVGQNVTGAGFSAVGASVIDAFFVQTPFVGAGVSYNQASGSINIASGTTTNAEFLARSVAPYRGAMRKRFTVLASQRIANTNFAVLLADLIGEGLAVTINSATSITVAIPGHTFDATNVGQFVLVGAISGAAGVPGRYAIASVVAGVSITLTVAGWPASGSCTATLFGRNYVRHLFNGTTATNAGIDAQRNGWATGDTTATIITTASPGVLLQTELTGREIFFSNSLRATSTAPNFTTIGSRYENIPDQNVDLYVFLWAFNGTTAPASSTTWTLGSLSVENFPNVPLYVQGFRSFGQQNAIPVQLQSGTAANVLGTVSLAAAQTLANVTTVAAVTAANLGIPGTIADVASAALTTTTTTAAFTPTFGSCYEVNVPVTAVTGSSPTLDFSVDESDDAGTNWFRVYDFPRITATGIYRSPKLPLTGNRIRYVQTVGGGTPSFTRAVNRLQSSDDADSIRQIIDRTITLTTGNSTTPSLNVQNCRNVQLVLNLGAATTPPALQLEGSEDGGASWYSIGSPLTGVASSTVQVTINFLQTQLIRARVSTAGASVTAGYVLIKGF